MKTVEELKKQFPVKDVAPYGSCIVIPGDKQYREKFRLKVKAFLEASA
jgi:hypothetical protein